MKSESQVKNQIQKLLRKKAFDFVKILTTKFPESRIYMVGGAVRDNFLGSDEIKDYDFVIRKVPVAKLEKTLSELGWVDLVGKTFGVLKFAPNGYEPFDIALPRTDHAFNQGGRRDVEVQSDPLLPIEEDLSRRDFTINAIAYQIYPQQRLIDPYLGIKDLRAKTIRTVGQPEKRFQEDYSRILRAIRFACQLGFKSDSTTTKALSKLATHVDDFRQGGTERVVPLEIVARELLKAFYYDPLKAFDLYDQFGLVAKFLPDLLKMRKCPQPSNYHTEGDVWTHTRIALANLQSKTYRKLFGPQKPSAQVVMAVLFHDVAKPVTIKTPEKDGTDRIRFNEHDTIGGQIVKSTAERLRFSSAGLGINPDALEWLISHHLILVHANVDIILNRTLEKYFFNPLKPGEDLLKLLYADGSATIPVGGKPQMQPFYQLLKRLKILGKVLKRREKIVKPILNGDEIMKSLKLKPGKIIGDLLEILREKQLKGELKTKSEAIKFLKQHYQK